MSLKWGAREIAKVVAAIDQDHESVDHAARACLAAMEEVFASRAKYTVVAQLARTIEDGNIDPSDPKAIKVALGWFSTEGDARSAAESLSMAHSTNEEYRAWVLGVFHGTAAGLLAERKATLQAEQEKRKEADKARFQKQIDKHKAAREKAVYEALAEQRAA